MTNFSITKLLALIHIVAISSLCFSGVASSQDGGTEIETEEQKLFYYMGTLYGSNLLPLSLKKDELDLVILGVREAAEGNAIKLDEIIYGPKLVQLGTERRAMLKAEEEPNAKAYLQRMAAEEDARTTESGMVFLSLEAGSGANPTPTSVVKVNYRGTLRDGTVFDSSYERGQAIDIPLDRVIPCWQEGIAMMQVGAKAKITCPAKIAYQDRGIGNIPPGAAITFEVELIEIIR
jgi:FKBP-type peptidyl-prolyl cis-trans isomerase FkpA